MLERLRTQIGTAGLVVAIVALVAALGGGAYAATGGSGGGKATASAKAKKGPRGPQGDTGPQGPAGPAGPKGATGATGAAGKDGVDGTDGAGVAVANEPPGPNCETAGKKVISPSGVDYICNGLDGVGGGGGPAGLPETLPIGKTLKGTFGVNGTTADVGGIFTGISFGVPLASALDSSHVHYSTDADFATSCSGSAESPTAASGHLCVYATLAENATFGGLYQLDGGTSGASAPGALLLFTPTSDQAFAFGSWAVTG